MIDHRYNITIHNGQTAIPRAFIAREAQRQFVEERDFQNAVCGVGKERYRTVAQHQHALRLEWRQMKMFRSIHNEVSCFVTLQSECNLRRSEAEWSTRSRLQTFK